MKTAAVSIVAVTVAATLLIPVAFAVLRGVELLKGLLG